MPALQGRHTGCVGKVGTVPFGIFLQYFHICTWVELPGLITSFDTCDPQANLKRRERGHSVTFDQLQWQYETYTATLEGLVAQVCFAKCCNS